ncbi:MAG: arylesterase [Rhodospirillales bacterium CG15_BIG_FIL_POST_REV_8_21_14_020_66_15]|nr:MAG: arylesterase [Rhodospirillales bacterium CG15_BIG_FIL_POST_REV_8_21_14_020_66_15]
MDPINSHRAASLTDGADRAVSSDRPSSQGYVAFSRLVNAAALALAVLLSAVPPSGAAQPLRLLVLGDSLTAGYGLAAEDAFTARLGAALKAAGRDATVLNAGVSGDTTAGGRARIGWALADRPDAVIVELGANDGLRGLDPRATRDNLDAILATVRAAGLPVLLTGMLAPPNLGRDYAEDFNAVYPRLAEKHGVPFYPFFLAGVAARPELNQDDGIHPNAKGVKVIVERILPYVLDLLARAGERADRS